MARMTKPLYHNGQFCGFSRSSAPSQSTSNSGSDVPVVRIDVAIRESGGRELTRERCGVNGWMPSPSGDVGESWDSFEAEESDQDRVCFSGSDAMEVSMRVGPSVVVVECRPSRSDPLAGSAILLTDAVTMEGMSASLLNRVPDNLEVGLPARSQEPKRALRVKRIKLKER